MLTNVFMNKRLQQFLFAENMSQSNFADSLGVARASVSHILSGRNKPGFDFLVSMSKAYPALNLEWLITGNGKMYRTVEKNESISEEPAATSSVASANPLTYDLFGEQFVKQPAKQVSATVSPFREAVQSSVEKDFAVQSTGRRSRNSSRVDINALSALQQGALNQKIITKIIACFSDGTFQEIAL